MLAGVSLSLREKPDPPSRRVATFACSFPVGGGTLPHRESAAMEASGSGTRPTLLGRLRVNPNDEVAWAEFVESYGRKIYEWCRAWGLQESDAQEVTQDVFVNLSVRMREFRYDPARSFRAWLKTVTRHAWHDYLVRQRRPGRGSGSESAVDRLEQVAAQDDLVRRIDETSDEELLKEASVRVQLRVEPHTWKAFELLALEGCSGADVATRLGMKVATVFVARSKVQRMLREELQRIEHG